jgi:hypothetical protein
METVKLKSVIDQVHPTEKSVEVHRYVDIIKEKGNVVNTTE